MGIFAKLLSYQVCVCSYIYKLSPSLPFPVLITRNPIGLLPGAGFEIRLPEAHTVIRRRSWTRAALGGLFLSCKPPFPSAGQLMSLQLCSSFSLPPSCQQTHTEHLVCTGHSAIPLGIPRQHGVSSCCTWGSVPVTWHSLIYLILTIALWRR